MKPAVEDSTLRSMSVVSYEQLRTELVPCVLHEPPDGYVPVPVTERLAQAIWFDQRLKRDGLQTADGRRVRVVSPGWWNLEAGPDFHRAVIAFDDARPQLGDVEVHLHSADWQQHGHTSDRLYDNVILHVALWRRGEQPVMTATGRALPQLVMADQLDAPLDQLYDSIDPENYPYDLDSHVGACESPLKSASPETIAALLEDAGLARLRTKARRLTRWIQRAGIEQALYTAVLEALGFKHNKEPMRRLAKQLPVTRLRELPAVQAQALLMGVAGFLPERTVAGRDEATRRYVKRLWDVWWKARDEFAGVTLSRDEWRLAGLRPANFPWRRLAAVAQLLAEHWELWPKIADALVSQPASKRAARLTALLTDLEDPYWSQRFSFASKPQSKAELLIGAARARDIVVNVLLPAAVAQGRLLEQPVLVEAAENIFAAHPSLESNALVRFTAHRLFGQRVPPRLLRTAVRQQGLLQVFHDFCLNDRSACQRCRFLELAGQFAAKQATL
ncbi:MAG: DUF2851 family protein [Verrucomicrobia bacterium]|nr:DUF2851 family protein [Verrucomicrobiota bacterium]